MLDYGKIILTVPFACIVTRFSTAVKKNKKISKGEKKQKVESALSKDGLSGYEKRKVFTLSGGEQQRVALAKIIAKSPRIILADEPTGSLDGENRDYVLKILEDLNKEGKTVIVVTHDPCVSRCAKKHICLFERRSRLCQKIEDAVDSDLVMIVAGL